MTHQENTRILVSISPAELIDKMSILEIKVEKITNPEKNKNVRHELEVLQEVFDRHITPSEELKTLIARLKTISQRGWDIEDIKRSCEREKDFGERFIEAARGAFKNNDERAAVWKEINLLLKSDIVQEKSYEKY